RTPLTEPGALLAPRFASDGSRLVVLAPAAEVPIYSPNQAHEVVDRQLVPFGGLDRDLRGFAWLPSGGGVGWAADGTRGALWTLGDHEPYRWPLGYVEPVSAVSVGPEGQVAFVGSMPQRAPELYVVDDAGVPARRLTNVNPPPPGVTPGHVETVTWTGPDGTPQDGVLVRPPDFDPSRRYPLVLSLHGGPMAACTEGWVGLRQLLAAHGWLVFCPNYRGSNHRGTAFQTNVLGDPAEGPSADILAGVDALRQRGIVDDARRALSGWSYGGYLAAWLAATSEGWVGAVAGAPVVDWRDAYVLSDLGPLFGPTIGPSPWDAGPAWDAASPLAHLDTYTTPTLILACTGDQRVPITHAYRLFSGLKARGTEVRFVAYPVSGHAPSDPVHQRDVMRRWVDWLWRAFQPPGADASATAASRAGSRGPGGG
ncbi:MAG: alpha/beta fold hydrolase, partial [Myxococcota bacterium]